MFKKSSARRLVENEVVFRQANERVQDDLKRHEARVKHEDPSAPQLENSIPLHFYCECANEKCRERIALLSVTYQELHQNKSQFIVKPGHNIPEIERIVTSDPMYLVVEKFMTPPPAADKLNPTTLP